MVACDHARRAPLDYLQRCGTALRRRLLAVSRNASRYSSETVTAAMQSMRLCVLRRVLQLLKMLGRKACWETVLRVLGLVTCPRRLLEAVWYDFSVTAFCAVKNC